MCLAYNLYDKPLFAGSAAASIYRPKKNIEGADDFGPGADDDDGEHAADRERISSILASRPHKGFSGTKDAPARDGPVQFEKARQSGSNQAQEQAVEADPFGLDQFLTEAAGKGKRGNALDVVGSGRGGFGHMRMAAGASQVTSEAASSSSSNSRKNIQFQSESSSAAKKRARHDSDEDE